MDNNMNQGSTSNINNKGINQNPALTPNAVGEPPKVSISTQVGVQQPQSATPLMQQVTPVQPQVSVAPKVEEQPKVSIPTQVGVQQPQSATQPMQQVTPVQPQVSVAPKVEEQTKVSIPTQVGVQQPQVTTQPKQQVTPVQPQVSVAQKAEEQPKVSIPPQASVQQPQGAAPWTQQVQPVPQIQPQVPTASATNVQDSDKVGELTSEEDREYLASLSPIQPIIDDDKTEINLPTISVEPQSLDKIQIVDIPEPTSNKNDEKNNKVSIFPIIILFLMLAGTVTYLYKLDEQKKNNNEITSNEESNNKSDEQSNSTSDLNESNSNIEESNSNTSNQTSGQQQVTSNKQK